MSLLDLILSQKIIVLSVGAALLLMAVAVLLTIIPRLQANAAKRRQTRAAQQAERATEKQARRAHQAVEAADTEDESEEVAAKPAKAATGRTKAAEPQAAIEQQSQAAQPAQAAPAPTPAPLNPADALPANEMQNILADVFVDDELLARYQVLLRGVSDISVSELLTLCQKIAGQVSAGLEPVTKEQ